MKLLGLCFLLLGVLVFTKPAYAHVGGVPIVKVNHEFTNVNVLEQNLVVDGTKIPTDSAPRNYVVNNPVTFQIEKAAIPYPAEILPLITFHWDFGDGTTASGDFVTHTYSHIGSYVVTAMIEVGDLSAFGITDTDSLSLPSQDIQVNIVSSKEYKTPEPRIFVNDREIKNQTKGELTFPFKEKVFGVFTRNKTFTFDASESSGSANIKRYYWELGNGEKTSTNPKVKHSFKTNDYNHRVRLKLVDENNFVTIRSFNLMNRDLEEGAEIEEVPITGIMIVGVIGGFSVIVISLCA